MTLDRLNHALNQELETLAHEGRTKPEERVIVGYLPPEGDRGPRYKLWGSDREYIRMNSNSYLSLSHHPTLIEAADEASRAFGVGPGAVRFIDGTFEHHTKLEERIARFVKKPAAKIFNSAYTANLGMALAVSSKSTYWVGDELNHNCIIRAMRIAAVARENKGIFKHNDMDSFREVLEGIPEGIDRVIVIFDGIFSMRGDNAPMKEMHAILEPYRNRFPAGVITVVDDSHGIGAYGATGRGTEEFCDTPADVTAGTFGKAFGVNGGFVASSREVVEAVRQKADTYIYTNPLSVADCAAAFAAVEIADSEEGRAQLTHLHARIEQFREGVSSLGMESIDGPHPVVPVLVRDTAKCQAMVRSLFEQGVLAVGLAFPVVPRGDDTIRFQLNAAHSEADVTDALTALATARG